MSLLVVDLDRLSELVSRLERYQSQLAAACADADARLRDVHTAWYGAAATNQATVHRQWQAGADEVHSALRVLRSAAAGALVNYSSASAANRRMWSL